MVHQFSKTQFPKMIKSGRILGELITAIPLTMFHVGKEVFKKAISLAPKIGPGLAGKAPVYYINKRGN